MLPAYRGGAPIQRSIMNGDTSTGITIMYMEAGMDSGDILSQREVEISNDDTSTTLFKKMSYVGRDLLMETLPLLIEGKITPQKQDESKVTFSYNIEAEEERIDFTKDASVIYNQIRALLDEPCAYFNFIGFDSDQDRIKVTKAKVGEQTTTKAPGEIVSVGKKSFVMACGNNTTLEILELIPCGKNKMPAASFINGGLRKYLKA